MIRPSITVLMLCVWCLPAPANGCELSHTSPWFATDAELAAGTTEIFVGRVISERPDANDRMSFRMEYQLEVVERIKGTPPARVWVGGFGPITPAARPDSRGRVSYGADCRMLAQFAQGQRYLVFRDAFHPKGYEQLALGEDAWLQAVRRLVRLSE